VIVSGSGNRVLLNRRNCFFGCSWSCGTGNIWTRGQNYYTVQPFSHGSHVSVAADDAKFSHWVAGVSFEPKEGYVNRTVRVIRFSRNGITSRPPSSRCRSLSLLRANTSTASSTLSMDFTFAESEVQNHLTDVNALTPATHNRRPLGAP
jgi:hypothetical protein